MVGRILGDVGRIRLMEVCGLEVQRERWERGMCLGAGSLESVT
jgi:hypothetical protein